MLAIEQRCCTDERTLGELFRIAVDEMRDITLTEALLYLMEQFVSCCETSLEAASDVASALLEDFVSKLPLGVQRVLTCIEGRCA